MDNAGFVQKEIQRILQEIEKGAGINEKTLTSEILKYNCELRLISLLSMKEQILEQIEISIYNWKYNLTEKQKQQTVEEYFDKKFDFSKIQPFNFNS